MKWITKSTYTFSDYFTKEEYDSSYTYFRQRYNYWIELYGEDKDTFLDDKYVSRTFYLLYARYGNYAILTNDYSIFEARLFETMLSNAKEWVKKSEIQDYLKSLDLDNEELIKSGKQLYNEALHDASSPDNGVEEELPYINTQRSTVGKKSKIGGLVDYYSILRSNINKEYVDKFKFLFNPFTGSTYPSVFITDEEDE